MFKIKYKININYIFAKPLSIKPILLFKLNKMGQKNVTNN